MTFKERRIKELKERIQTMQNEIQTLQSKLEEISKEDSSWVDLDVNLLDMEDFPDNDTNGHPYIVLAIMQATDNIPVYARNITIGDLISCKKEDIARGRCIGKKRMEKLTAWMNKYNLKFTDEF